MGCKPSKESLRASASAVVHSNHENNHNIKSAIDKDVIEDIAEQQKIVRLKESDDEQEETTVTNKKQELAPAVGPTSEQEEEKAAVVIQSRFRGYKIRKDMAVDQQASKAELEAEFSKDDKELCKAATKIQASFRGHQVRAGKAVSGTSGEGDEAAGGTVDELSQNLEKMVPKTEDDELADIDLSDPELHKAATKIQASFRGHKVRKDDH